MEIMLDELMQTLTRLSNGEPAGPLGVVIVCAGFALGFMLAGWLAGSLARLYGQMHYQDAEKRRKWLEGDNLENEQ